ncbi:MAG: hypothetical protein JW839_01525 [Candidatus Lokiarchaeota archaeon]|nr:hypothetical protein [Candidatus Lokiarchaeota archaeon]
MPASRSFLEHNIAEIRGLNQRGGRMLSIVDLIARGTVNIELAAHLLVEIRCGASFLCCALQGGVGKTALMGALLGLLPASEEIVTVASRVDVGTLRSRARDGDRRCLVVHEIGSGPWYGYLWGAPVLDYMGMKNATTRIVSNMHADTLEQVEAQLVSFGGTAADARVFDLILFIALGEGRAGGERKRVVTEVVEARGNPGSRTAHELQLGTKQDVAHATRGNGRRQHEIRAAVDLLQGLIDEGTMQLENVAARVAAFHDELDLENAPCAGHE